MATTKKSASKKSAAKNVAMTKEDKNPSGGLTDKGRAKLKAAGHNIQPGVMNKDSELTPEEMQRKGSFLRRHYANPRGSLTDAKGEPTRFALQAQAWGERIPKTEADVQKLADKGTKLLDRFHKLQDNSKTAKKSAGKKSAAKKSPTKKSSSASDDIYTDPALRERLKQEILAGDKGGKPNQWSARKAQLLAQEYERAGGGYKQGAKKGVAQKSLSKWTDEDWQTSDKKPAERAGGTTRYLPKEAWDKLTPAQKRATDKKKQEGSRKGEQFVANTSAAKSARKGTTSGGKTAAKQGTTASAAKKTAAKKSPAKKSASKKSASKSG